MAERRERPFTVRVLSRVTYLREVKVTATSARAARKLAVDEAKSLPLEAWEFGDGPHHVRATEVVDDS